MVALILLAVMSVLGIANMKSTTLEMRMVGSMSDRQRAFALTDGALEQIEQRLGSTSGGINVRRQHMSASCSGDLCFTSTCTNGRCFDGTYESSTQDEFECAVADNAGTSERQVYWQDASIWSDGSGNYAETIVSGASGSVSDTTVKYIIEFLCYAADGVSTFSATQPNNGVGLFRITAFNDVTTPKTPVMLQSTFMLNRF